MPNERGPAITQETLGVTPRYVLQHNGISRSAHDLSATAKKLTAMAMALLPPDLSSLTAAFSFPEFCKALGSPIGGEQYRIFKAAVDECLQSVITVETEPDKNGKKKWQKFTWFIHAQFDEKTGQATMTFSPKLAEFLMAMKWMYSKISLKDLGELQSRYSIRLFEIATSYMSLQGKQGNEDQGWYFERSIEEFRKIMGIPKEAYPITHLFKQKVIESPAKEINSAGIGLEIKSEGVKQGRNLVAIRLNCKRTPRKAPAKRTRKKKTDENQPDTPDLFTNDEKSRVEKELEHLKELYPEEFAGLYEAALSQIPALGGGAGESFRRAAAERRALESLRAAHGIVK
ncbi:MAG: replication initiation protein [Treponema sp.]|jgi:plasmid replication initiation protein|nr:replication initiation protein [Treponema sp.]